MPTATSLRDSFQGKRVLVTGHAGFKGSWLSLWLSELGATVAGYGHAPEGIQGLYRHLQQAVFAEEYRNDIVDQETFGRALSEFQPDYVFHLAAQPLVRLSYQDPIGTLTSNVVGSAVILDAIRKLTKTCHVVFVTSDKCYRNREWHFSYRESDELGGKDPYSMSKAAAELVAESWRRSYFDNHSFGSTVTSVRAGNVIGGGDYSNDRLVPDCVRAALSHQPLTIRSPHATRPWQHVLDCLHGYLVVASQVPAMRQSYSVDPRELECFNFGPLEANDHPVAEVAERFFAEWPRETPGVQIMQAEKTMSEACYLSVSIEKAQRLLGWRPAWNFAQAMEKTVEWYAACHLEDADMVSFSRRQIEEFSRAANCDIDTVMA